MRLVPNGDVLCLYLIDIIVVDPLGNAPSLRLKLFHVDFMDLKKFSEGSKHYVLCKQDERQFISSHKVMRSPIADGSLPDAPRRAVIET
jgi:hypothetical protein